MAKVFLSAGHGGSDPGACANGLLEKTINLNTLKACKQELERHGVKVVASRTTDAYDPVQAEVREANASGASLAVSFHANAGGGDGWEAFCWAGDAKGRKLAKLAEKHVKALGQNSRGIKSGNHLMFVNSTKMTAVLFESFFVDSKDRYVGDTAAEQKAFGVAYAKAILEYLGIEYKAKKTTTATNAATADAAAKVDAAASFQSGLAGEYKATAALNLRNGAGAAKKSQGVMPKGNRVRCFGYYTAVNGTKWLLVETTMGGKKRTGFCSKKYLNKM